MKVEDWLGCDNKIGIDIFNSKYRFDGESFEAWLDRVSNCNELIKDLIISKKFLFGGRILANRGLQKLGKKISYSNCYVLPSPDDNIESIFDTAKNMARTYSYGGGVGICLDNLRPKNALVNNAAKTTSGAVSFMDLFNTTTDVIAQNGRRAALMLSMSVSHPDVEEFIDSKNDLSKVNKANISIRVDDEFMRCVYSGADYISKFTLASGEVINKTINPKDVLKKLANNNWETGEPGVLFWDRIEDHSIMGKGYFENVNPCGELPLPANGSCNLGSINLAEFVEDGVFNWFSFESCVRIAVEELDNLVTEGAKLHPLATQTVEALNHRPIGLGVMGLADALIKLEITYGSSESLEFINIVFDCMKTVALLTSVNLAKMHGAFSDWSNEKLISSSFFKGVNPYTISTIEKHGLRNSQLLTIAPTGTISTMIGVSGGIEPIYQLEYERRTESLFEVDKSYTIITQIANDYMELNNIYSVENLPEFFITSSQVDWADRIRVQATAQAHIDNAISSTINLPNSVSSELIASIYMVAWQLGLKGLTVFRDGCLRQGILTVKNVCEKCGTELANSEGCIICHGCGHSKCGG